MGIFKDKFLESQMLIPFLLHSLTTFYHLAPRSRPFLNVLRKTKLQFCFQFTHSKRTSRGVERLLILNNQLFHPENANYNVVCDYAKLIYRYYTDLYKTNGIFNTGYKIVEAFPSTQRLEKPQLSETKPHNYI